MLTPTDLRRVADLLRYAPSAADIDERWNYVMTLYDEADSIDAQHKETRP